MGNLDLFSNSKKLVIPMVQVTIAVVDGGGSNMLRCLFLLWTSLYTF